ncbi:MAG: hypothetical protein SOZ06_06265 [Candidatus Faecenecus gallistercoris]|nr:hypothetical protein [Bacillota bacterium]MDD7102164.1 hypothetical protein [Bacillota bacterium]MDY4051549.1 hypothetical protein [Candidatus Faecenecus gallistercoris]
MKIGFRKPSLKKSIKARTTGKIKRAFKKSSNPFYGKRGMGLLKNPKKAIYNKVYSKTTVGISDLLVSNNKKQTSNKSK